jgi:hypothetical protein
VCQQRGNGPAYEIAEVIVDLPPDRKFQKEPYFRFGETPILSRGLYVLNQRREAILVGGEMYLAGRATALHGIAKF